LFTAFGLDEKTIYNHLAWAAPTKSLVVLQTNLDDAKITAVRLWNVATGAPLAEFRGGKR